MRNWETILSVILINHTSPWYPHSSRDGICIVVAMVSIENENDTKRNEIARDSSRRQVYRNSKTSSRFFPSSLVFSLFVFLNSLTPSLHSYSLVLTLPLPLPISHSLSFSRVASVSATCVHAFNALLVILPLVYTLAFTSCFVPVFSFRSSFLFSSFC